MNFTRSFSVIETPFLYHFKDNLKVYMILLISMVFLLYLRSYNHLNNAMYENHPKKGLII